MSQRAGRPGVVRGLLTLTGLIQLSLRSIRVGAMAESPLQEWKSSYVASVRDVFRAMEEYGSRLGKIVRLEGRYPRLRPLQVNRGERSTIPYSGSLLEQAEVTKSLEKYSPSRVQDLFVPDSSGFVPKTVVLVGPPGIGKTLTSQKILVDWASGVLYGDTFNFVFYLSGKEMNKMEGNVNITTLVARSSTLHCSERLIKSAFNDPSKVLVVFDGFDELRWTLEDDYEDYEDPFQDTHKETFLRCLFSKEILKETSLIITSRSMCLQKMKDFAQSPSSIELLGFSETDLEQYLHNFFENKAQVDEATSVFKENEVLMALCSVPFTCWLVCSILRAGMKKDLSSAHCRTLTSVYLLYLRSLLSNHRNNQPVLECLKKLCAMANEGILNQKSLFDVEDLGTFGLTPSEVASVFLNDAILQKDAEDATDYSFIHLSVQEFLAALYYVLGEDAEVKEMNGASADTFLPKVCKEQSLSGQSQYHPHLSCTVRFLFGLLNDKQVKEFVCGLGSNASLRAKSAMEKWLRAGNPSSFCSDALTCFYEAQDEELCRAVFNVQDLVFEQTSYCSAMAHAPTREMLYCLTGRQSFKSITLEDHLMRPQDLDLLSPLFHRSSKLSFVRCGFVEDTETGEKASWLSNPHSNIQELEFHVCVVAPSFFQDLRSFISSSQSLSKLVISNHILENTEFKILCEVLRQPGCTVRELELNNCNLTATSCEHLGSALQANRSLQKIDLVLNELEDEGVKFLCEGLKDPGCTVQELSIAFSELTPACCEYFHSVLISNRTLTTLDLRECNVQDTGAKRLCEALCQPGCVLKKLGLFENNMSSACCEVVRSLLLTNKTLISLNLRDNELQDSGVKLLCEGLRDPGCILQELILNNCELTQASCEDLRSVLITNRSLTNLALTWNALEDSGVKVLCEGLRDPRCILQELCLYYCHLSSSSLEELSSVMTTNHSLTKLDLAGNKYEDTGVKSLCAALRAAGCTLQELRVGYCHMTESCAEEFLAVINTNRSLTELDVSFAYEDEEPPADLDLRCRKFEHPACTLRKHDTQDGMFIYFEYRKPK